MEGGNCGGVMHPRGFLAESRRDGRGYVSTMEKGPTPLMLRLYATMKNENFSLFEIQNLISTRESVRFVCNRDYSIVGIKYSFIAIIREVD